MSEPKTEEKTKSYEFDDFHLSGPMKELRQGDAAVDIQRRVLDLLTFLIENRERTVSKDEIQDAVWPGTIVTEAALTRAVMKARRAVGDDAQAQRVIKTVHGQGYRFVAEISEVEDNQRGLSEDARGARRQALLRVATTYGAGAWLLNQAAAMVWEAFEWERWPQQLLLAVSVLGFPLVLAFTWFYRATSHGVVLRSERRQLEPSRSSHWERVVIGMLALALALSIGWNLREQSVAPVAIDRIAVLPLHNRTGDAELSWLSLGMLGLLQAQLTEADVPVVTAQAIMSDVPEPVADVTDELLERLALTRAARIVVDVGVVQTGTEYATAGHYYESGQRYELPSFTGESPSAAVRTLGRHLIEMLNPRVTSVDVEYASGDLFVDQAFARGMHEMLSGNIESAKDLLQVAVNGKPDAFWPAYELAIAIHNLGDLADAERRLEALLNEGRVLEEAKYIAVTSNQLGIIHDLTGDLDQSEAHYVEGLEWAERAGLHERRAVLLINYAILERARARPVAARELLGRALSAYQDAGIELLPGDFYLTLGNTAADAGDYSGARDQYRQALNNYRAMTRTRGEGIALSNLSWASEQLGDYEASFQYLEESAALRERIGDRVGVLRSKVRRADLLYALGRLDEVLVLVDAVAADDYVQKEQEILATAFRFRAAVAADREAHADALALYREALAIDEAGGRVRAVCEARLGAARALIALERPGEARHELDILTDVADERSLPNVALKIMQVQADLDLAGGDVAAAIATLKNAADEARVQANTRDLALIATDLADVYFAAGDLENLESWVGVALDAHPVHGRVKLAAAQLAYLKGDSTRVRELVVEAQELMGERIEVEGRSLLARLEAQAGT